MIETTVSSHNYLIVGATSGIARALARRLAADSIRYGRRSGFVLAGRDEAELRRQAADLTTRFDCQAVVRRYDAADLDATSQFLADCTEALPGGLHELILCHGWLPDGEEAKINPQIQRKLIDINYTSAVLLLEQAATYFQAQEARGQQCAITALSSVAGDRGRQSNYPYGASKAALTAYLSGLRNRLHRVGIPVLTVKPGFVDTGMTWGLIKPDSPVNAAPERVAGDIAKAMRGRKNAIYTPWFWWGIMTIFKVMPEFVFKRLKT